MMIQVFYSILNIQIKCTWMYKNQKRVRYVEMGAKEHHTSCARTTESYPASVRVWGKHTLDAESTVPCWRDSLQTALTSYSYDYGWYVAKKTFQETDWHVFPLPWHQRPFGAVAVTLLSEFTNTRLGLENKQKVVHKYLSQR